MTGFKKYLVSLIPLVLLTAAGFILDFVIYGSEMFDEEQSIILIGILCGLVTQLIFIYSSEFHPFFKVLCWIGIVLFGLVALIAGTSLVFVGSSFVTHGDKTLFVHITIGLGVAAALMFIYSFIAPATGFGEEYPIITRIGVPILIFAAGIIGGGYFRLLGEKFLNTLTSILMFGPIGANIILLVVFIKTGLLDVGGYSGGSSRRSYSGGHSYSGGYSSSSSSNNVPDEATLNAILVGTSASDSMGCTVTLRIASVSLIGSSVSIDIEESVEHRNGDNENYYGARNNAERKLYRAANQRLSNRGYSVRLG